MAFIGATTKLVRNWLHQSISYLDRGERRVRLAIETIQIVIVCAVIWLINGSLSLTAGLISVIAVHTFNWISNANFWVLVQSILPLMRNRGPLETRRYLETMQTRLSKHLSVTGLLALGSIAKHRFTDRSDIDLRLVRRPGFGSLLATALLVMRERLYALLQRHPLDIYLADDPAFLDRMRLDETPLFLIKRDPRLDARFPNLGLADLSLQKLSTVIPNEERPYRVACLLPETEILAGHAQFMREASRATQVEFWPIGSATLPAIGPRQFLRLMRKLDHIHPDFVLTHDNRSRRLAGLMRLLAGTSRIPQVHICIEGEQQKLAARNNRKVVVQNKRDACRLVARYLVTERPSAIAGTRSTPEPVSAR